MNKKYFSSPFKIETPHEEVFLACKNAASHKSWLEILRSKISDFKLHEERYAAAGRNQEMAQMRVRYIQYLSY